MRDRGGTGNLWWMNLLEPPDLVGKTVAGVTASWHVFDRQRDTDVMHFWLHLEPELGPVRFHTPGAGSVQLTVEPPYEPYNLDEYGSVVVEPVSAGHLLASLAGRRIVNATTLVRADDDREEAGLVLHLDSGAAVAVVNDVDELSVQQWPSATITAWGYVERQR